MNSSGESGLVVNKKEEASVSFAEEEPKKGGEKDNSIISSGSGKKDSLVSVPGVTTTKVVESGLVANKRKEEAPMSSAEEEPKKGGEKDNSIISSGSDKKDSLVSVPGVTTAKVVESGLVANKKKEEASMSFAQGAPKFQGIFFIPPLLEPCKTVPYLNLREITKNLLMSSEIKGFHANYVKCLSILQL